MKIKFFGTAAAEGIPAFFCECTACRKARELGGREVRTRSQALIDGELLLDFPPDTYMHSVSYGLDLTKVKDLFITHSHYDHLFEVDIIRKRPPNARDIKIKTLNVFAAKSSIDRINAFYNGEECLNLKLIKPFDVVNTNGYEITALKALHAESTTPVFYIIKKDGKALMYGHDTNYFCDETWEWLEKNKPYLNLVSLDCTSANTPVMGYVGHMNLNDNVKVKERLMEIGCADEKTVFISNHFSHNGANVNYCEFEPIARQRGFLTSYDGMEVEI